MTVWFIKPVCFYRHITHLYLNTSKGCNNWFWSFAIVQNNKPLYSFEDNSDYVYDVMWSPTHPALFACVDGVGHLDLWNLNNDTEVLQHTPHFVIQTKTFLVFH